MYDNGAEASNFFGHAIGLYRGPTNNDALPPLGNLTWKSTTDQLGNKEGNTGPENLGLLGVIELSPGRVGKRSPLQLWFRGLQTHAYRLYKPQPNKGGRV